MFVGCPILHDRLGETPKVQDTDLQYDPLRRRRRVRTVGDYLDISVAAARQQWRALETRPRVATGRQVDFVPVETLLCLAASLLVNHRRYGGSTAHRAEPPVPSLASLFRRPNSSILAKMAN